MDVTKDFSTDLTNGMYRYVNHKESLATRGYRTYEELLSNARTHALRDTYERQRVRYLKFYGNREAPKYRRISDRVEYHPMWVIGCGAVETLKRGAGRVRPVTTTKGVTRRDLELEYWGPVHDMVAEYNAKNNCNVKPWGCVRKHGRDVGFLNHPDFSNPPEDYQTAVAILWNEETKKHQPVFVGDVLYLKDGGAAGYEVTRKGYRSGGLSDNTYNWQKEDNTGWTWTAPKPEREFGLNGEKLPCPRAFKDGIRPPYFTLEINGDLFYFDCESGRNLVRNALRKLLADARDK